MLKAKPPTLLILNQAGTDIGIGAGLHLGSTIEGIDSRLSTSN